MPVAEVRLVGFTHFGEGWVRQRLDTRASSGEEPRLLQTPLLERDRLRIQSWYRDAGFTRAEVPPPEVWPEAGPAGAVVIFSVREGPRTLVRSVSFAGAVALSRAQLLAAAGFQEGAPFRDADLKPAADRVRAAYARAGYPQCAVTVRPDFGADRTRVDLRFTVDEGRLQRLGGIAVTGNARTARRVILRELPLAPGDPLDPEALAKGKSELYDLGLFREVRYVLPEPVSPGGPQDVVLAVRERPTGFVGFGVGYSSDEQLPRVRGGRRAESLRHRAGPALEVEGQRDRLPPRPVLPGALALQLPAQGAGRPLPREPRRRPGTRCAARVWRSGSTGSSRRGCCSTCATATSSWTTRTSTRISRPSSAPWRTSTSAASASWSTTTAATTRSPRGGAPTSWRASRLRGRSSAATPRSPSISSNPSWYLPLWTGAEIALGLRGGFTQLLLGAGDLPLSERFFLGGDRSVRGYGYKEIGPKDAAGNPLGGNAFALGNVELRFSLYRKLRGVLFFDAGELWADQAGLPASGIKTSVGTGLRYETLVGPIRLDWGYKLKPEPGESPSRWHLTIGYPF